MRKSRQRLSNSRHTSGERQSWMPPGAIDPRSRIQGDELDPTIGSGLPRNRSVDCCSEFNPSNGMPCISSDSLGLKPFHKSVRERNAKRSGARTLNPDFTPVVWEEKRGWRTQSFAWMSLFFLQARVHPHELPQTVCVDVHQQDPFERLSACPHHLSG